MPTRLTEWSDTNVRMGRFFGWFAASTVRLTLTIVAVCVVVVGAVIGGVVINDSRNATNTARAAREAVEQSVTDACKSAVAAKLKSPGSAQWSNVEASRPYGNFTWKVEGKVDSQNGFGALVRGEFLCAVEVDGRGNVTSTEADLTMRE